MMVVDGGGRERETPASILSIASNGGRERAEDRGQKFFRFRISFCSFPLGDPASAGGPWWKAFRHLFLFVSGCGLKSAGPRVGARGVKS